MQFHSLTVYRVKDSSARNETPFENLENFENPFHQEYRIFFVKKVTNNSPPNVPLKGQCHRIFDNCFFLSNSSSMSFKTFSGTILIFAKHSWRYLT